MNIEIKKSLKPVKYEDALVFINEDGEVTAYHHDGCYVCESN